MLFCCFSFQGFSLSTKRLRGQVREWGEVVRPSFWAEAVPSLASTEFPLSRKMGYFRQLAKNTLLCCHLVRNLDQGGRGVGEKEARERERVRTFFTYLGSAMGPRLWIVIASASSVHPSSILSGKKLPWTQNFVTFAGKGSHFARPNHFAFKSKKFWFAEKVEGCQNAGLRSDCESNCWWCSWMLNKHRRWLN